jgi:methylase of polypeptide subunit release factors
MNVSATPTDRPVLPPVPEPDDAGSLAGVRDALIRGGFEEPVMDRLAAFMPRLQSIVAGRLWPELPALPALIDLFRSGLAARVQDAEAALGAQQLTWLHDRGVLVREGSEARSNFRLEPFRGVLVMADYPSPEKQWAFETVQSLTTASSLLDNLTIRDDVSSVLDLGTGSGVLALRAAAHAERVVGVDVNPRAIAFARFNAALNGVTNLEARVGTWLEPVQGERFDLVVGNLPFIISPDYQLLYRDSGDPAGEGMASLIRAVPDALADGGIVQFLCQWPIRSGQAWVDPIREWAAGADRRVLVLQILLEDVVQYVARTAPQTGGDGPHRETVRRWLRHFDDIGAEAMGFGMVVLQHRPGPGRIAAAVASFENGDGAGAHVLRLLAAADSTWMLEDERVALGQRVRLVDGLHFGQTAVYRDGRHADGDCVIRDSRGLLGLSARVPAVAVPVLRGCGPDTRLGEVVEQAAARFGLDRDVLAKVSLAAVRELVAKGLLAMEP